MSSISAFARSGPMPRSKARWNACAISGNCLSAPPISTTWKETTWPNPTRCRPSGGGSMTKGLGTWLKRCSA
jgi:hypothetical protein